MKKEMTFRWLALALVLLTGCSTKATITLRSGASFDAKILGSDENHVYVDLVGKGGLDREDIEDIDHPGNVAAILGGIVAAYGVVNIAVGVPQCGTNGPAYCTGVFIPAVIGASALTWGSVTYSRSVTAAGSPESKGSLGSVSRISVVPTHEFAGRPKTPGLLVGGAF